MQPKLSLRARIRPFVFTVVVLGLLTGCALKPDGDRPLDAYKPDSGALPIDVVDIELPFAELDKTLPLRVTHPTSEPGSDRRFPVILFSHGGRCWHNRYDSFAQHWASHGYVVIQPAHLDARSGPPSRLKGMQMMNTAVETRRQDLIHILDSLAAFGDYVPALAGRLDAERVAAAGHSMGGGTAMSVTGLTMVDPSNDSEFGFVDERFDVLLLLTDPGNSPMMPTDPWRAVTLPTFVATGTNDFSGLVRIIKKSKSVYRFPDDLRFTNTPNHYLFIEAMDHYLGGLICKPIEDGVPDVDAARIIGGASVAFLDAYLRNDRAARAFLRAGNLIETEPRATLDVR